MDGAKQFAALSVDSKAAGLKVIEPRNSSRWELTGC